MGWRTEGIVAKKSFLCQRLRPLFCLFFASFLAVFLGPPPANPLSKPLIAGIQRKRGEGLTVHARNWTICPFGIIIILQCMVFFASTLDIFPFKRTVCGEIITELVLQRAGPAILKTFLLALTAFRLIPVICPARRAKRENYWKR